MSVKREEWGFFNGYKVYLFTLENENMKFMLTNYGAAMVSIIVPNKDGNLVDVLLGYDNLEGYVGGNSFQGALAGRYANRIGGAEFRVNDEVIKLYKNDGDNCLHGGKVGFDKRVFVPAVTGENKVVMKYISPDGEENFPGTLDITVSYTLTENSVVIEYDAVSDRDTVINLTNHSYFNLGGGKRNILDHVLQMDAKKYTPVGDDLIPTGEIADVEGTVFDFRTAKAIGEDINSGKTKGYDHNFMTGDSGVMKKIATIHSPETGIKMITHSDKPAVQLYVALGLNEPGKGGKNMGIYDGFCLETQFSPNSPNNPKFPSCFYRKGDKYNFKTVYEFGTI